jgi:2-polyprenyl-6-methoxyphenol hydroxylase-like FAD-dependent oxidoreductase
MSKLPQQRRKSVLVSGASIAGPALAYWLDRYGFDVTVVERAPGVRSGGYPIDVRGTAVDVIERMGVGRELQAAHIAARAVTFVDANGCSLGAIPPYDLSGNDARDVELLRGTLTSMLYEASKKGAARYRFNDSIETLANDGVGVDVRFRSGERQRYDVVLAADGVHSHTRELVFGPEGPFRRDLGYWINLFSMPNDFGLSHGARFFSVPGRTAGVLAVRDSKDVFAALIFTEDTPSSGEHFDQSTQYRRAAAAFSAGGWEVPRLLEAMKNAKDLYFDSVSQIHMPRWSAGRVALVGDAAYAPSFLSGQGTSMALVGAYVLAGELASHDNPSDAFAAYEQLTRPFMEANQGLATRDTGSLLLPRTQAAIDARNALLARLDAGATVGDSADTAREVHNALQLPDYPRRSVPEAAAQTD